MRTTEGEGACMTCGGKTLNRLTGLWGRYECSHVFSGRTISLCSKHKNRNKQTDRLRIFRGHTESSRQPVNKDVKDAAWKNYFFTVLSLWALSTNIPVDCCDFVSPLYAVLPLSTFWNIVLFTMSWFCTYLKLLFGHFLQSG